MHGKILILNIWISEEIRKNKNTEDDYDKRIMLSHEKCAIVCSKNKQKALANKDNRMKEVDCYVQQCLLIPTLSNKIACHKTVVVIDPRDTRAVEEAAHNKQINEPESSKSQ